MNFYDLHNKIEFSFQDALATVKQHRSIVQGEIEFPGATLSIS